MAIFLAVSGVAWGDDKDPVSSPASPGEAATPGESTADESTPEDAPTPTDVQPVEPVSIAPIQVAPIDVEGGLTDATGPRDLTAPAPRSRDADRGLEESGFVTEIRVDQADGETASIAEVFAESMGVHVRTLGGLGAFSSISVRGASSGHTAVLVDGVPLSRIASVSGDLGRFALDSFAALELYRGGAPVAMGGTALGGALNLVTAVGKPSDGRPLTLSAGAGSFGARHLRARWSDGSDDGGHGFHASLGYAGATGDFRYSNDNGTNLIPDDDELVTRENNHYDQLDALARYRARRGDLTLEAGSRSLFKSQGIPGTASVQSRSSELTTISQLLDLRLRRQNLFDSPQLLGTGSTFAILEWQHYRDLDSEVGVGSQDRRYRSLSIGSTAGLSVDVNPVHTMNAGVEARLDYFTENDALSNDENSLRSHGWRTGGAIHLSDDIVLGAAEQVLLQPAIRLDWLRTVPIDDSNQPVVDDEGLATRNDLLISPRLAYRLRLGEDLAVKGSAGRYFRAPTVVELYGDRGFVVGNPDLDAETGLSGDIGLVWAPARPVATAMGGIDRVYIETAAFVRRSSDTISFATTMGLAARALNLGDTSIRGLETGASLRLARFATLRANYTLLVTRQESTLPSFEGKPLPHRPRHQLYGRIDLARELNHRLIVAWGDVTLATGNFLDPAGLAEVPARRLFSAGVKFAPVRDLLIGIEGKNLANSRIETIPLDPAPRPDLAEIPRAISDFFGYPLPGRAFYLTAQWKR